MDVLPTVVNIFANSTWLHESIGTVVLDLLFTSLSFAGLTLLVFGRSIQKGKRLRALVTGAAVLFILHAITWAAYQAIGSGHVTPLGFMELSAGLLIQNAPFGNVLSSMLAIGGRTAHEAEMSAMVFFLCLVLWIVGVGLLLLF